jgi:murein DD-endopeptidase MepM/ murein hydrolase activator NlpD
MSGQKDVGKGRWLTRVAAVLAAKTWRWNSDRLGQRPILGRWPAHTAVFLIVILLWSFTTFSLRVPGGAASEAERPAVALQDRAASRAGSSRRFLGSFSYRVNAQSRIIRQSDPHTVIPERPRLEIVTYVVQAGDTTESIAEQFGLEPTTIMWSNPAIEKAPDLLKVGQSLVILPIDGVYHTVEEGDTLEQLAEDYKVSVKDIIECPFNDIPHDQELDDGDKVIVPGGTKPYERREVTTYAGSVPENAVGNGIFSWPASGHISQGYWYGHRAIDIANAVGTAIVASDAGYVSFAGWTDIGYGYLVVVDHANGYQTYYAHLSDIYVIEGQAVEAGKVIAAMGSTGNSTGPHLHFEVRYNRYPTNPLVYLP